MLVMTLLVRDEADVLADMLDAHFALGVDHVIATDNRSVDATPAILRRYVDEGRCTVIDEPGEDYRQADWVTRMARLAATDHRADWVINADADEFWIPTAGGSLTDLFAGLPDDVGAVAALRHNYVVRPGDDGWFLDRMRWRRTDSLTQDGQVMGPKVAHRASADVRVAMGNHSVAGIPGRVLSDGRLEVLHFPLRTMAGYAAKIDVGTTALEANAAYPVEIGAHWRRSAELVRSGELAEAWRSWTFDDERLHVAVTAGEVVQDDRIRDLLEVARAPGRGKQRWWRAR